MRTYLSLGLIACAACGASESRTVSGKIELASFGRTSAEIVVARADRTTSSESVRPDGSFEIELAAGESQAIAFRSIERGRVATFANLVFQTASGKTGVVRVTSGDPIEIGDVSSEDRSSCRGAPETTNPGTPDTADPTPPAEDPSIALFTSFLVAADDDLVATNEEDTADHSNDGLADSDGDDRPDSLDDDDDADGLCDEDDDQPGDDDGPDGGVDEPGDEPSEGRAELPYDARLSIGDTFTLMDAFAEKGALPAEITDVEMDGGDWRLMELRSGTPFTVTEADCTHEGNRDVGRDRIFVAWRNTDGSTEVDHLDMRYCD